MLSNITIRTTCELCDMETWHSAETGFFYVNKDGDLITNLAFSFKCPGEFCNKISQLMPLPTVSIALLWELDEIDKLLMSIDVLLSKFSEPLATWTDMQLGIICENSECLELESFPPSMFGVKPMNLGYISVGLAHCTCPHCEDEQILTVSDAARLALVILGADEEEWSKTVFSFICTECDSASVVDGMQFALELTEKEDPSRKWLDSIESVAVFTYCTECGYEDIAMVERSQYPDAIADLIDEMPLSTELHDTVAACDVCGPLDASEYPYRALPFSVGMYGYEGEDHSVVAMWCPRCSLEGNEELPAWFVPSGPYVLELLKIVGITVTRRLDVTPFSDEEIYNLEAEIDSADPDDFFEEE